MKITLHLITSTIAAVIALFCAILAYQNAVPIQLNFFGVKSIEMPLGFVLVSAIALGLISMPIVLGLLKMSFNKPAKRRS